MVMSRGGGFAGVEGDFSDARGLNVTSRKSSQKIVVCVLQHNCCY